MGTPRDLLRSSHPLLPTDPSHKERPLLSHSTPLPHTLLDTPSMPQLLPMLPQLLPTVPSMLPQSLPTLSTLPQLLPMLSMLPQLSTLPQLIMPQSRLDMLLMTPTREPLSTQRTQLHTRLPQLQLTMLK